MLLTVDSCMVLAESLMKYNGIVREKCVIMFDLYDK